MRPSFSSSPTMVLSKFALLRCRKGHGPLAFFLGNCAFLRMPDGLSLEGAPSKRARSNGLADIHTVYHGDRLTKMHIIRDTLTKQRGKRCVAREYNGDQLWGHAI